MKKTDIMNSLPSSAAKQVQEVQTLHQQVQQNIPQMSQRLLMIQNQVRQIASNQPEPFPQWLPWTILGLLALIVVLLLVLLLKSQPVSLICQPSRINGKTYTVCQPWQ